MKNKNGFNRPKINTLKLFSVYEKFHNKMLGGKYCPIASRILICIISEKKIQFAFTFHVPIISFASIAKVFKLEVGPKIHHRRRTVPFEEKYLGKLVRFRKWDLNNSSCGVKVCCVRN